MNEFELIYELLENFNRRLSYLESGPEGWAPEEKEAKALLDRLKKVIPTRRPT